MPPSEIERIGALATALRDSPTWHWISGEMRQELDGLVERVLMGIDDHDEYLRCVAEIKCLRHWLDRPGEAIDERDQHRGAQ